MSDPATELLAMLVAINSINPSLVPSGPGEAEIASFIQRWLQGGGIDTELVEALPGRPSVIGRVRGTGGGRSLILCAHIDTVGVAGMTDPFNPRVRDGKLFGRGAYDMKAGLAACLLALRDARGAHLAGDVILAAVADEEHASYGIQTLLKRMTAHAAIVTEPTELEVVVAHKGFSWHEIVAHGRAAHGSRPDLGIDAIVHMGRVLAGLESLQAELNRRAPHPLLAHASVHASFIAGGRELSSYPDHCKLEIERRTLPGETSHGVEEEFRALLAKLRSEDPSFQADFRTTLVRPPFTVAAEEEIVRVVSAQAEKVRGRRTVLRGSTPWMDAAFLAEAGIPTVVIGPAGSGAHAIEEWADLDSVEQCRRVLFGTIQEFCR